MTLDCERMMHGRRCCGQRCGVTAMVSGLGSKFLRLVSDIATPCMMHCSALRMVP